MLTKLQHKTLLFIYRYIEDNQGLAPTYETIKTELGLASRSQVKRLVDEICKKGYAEKTAHKANSIRIIKKPWEQNNVEPTPSPVTTERISPSSTSVKDLKDSENLAILYNIPVYGCVSPGTPIEAIRNESDLITVPSSVLNGAPEDEFYALYVKGDSMINAGILDGDLAIIHRPNDVKEPQNGSIVLALVNNEEATLKYYKQFLGRVLLESANPEYPIQEYPLDAVATQGQLVSLIRKY